MQWQKSNMDVASAQETVDFLDKKIAGSQPKESAEERMRKTIKKARKEARVNATEAVEQEEKEEETAEEEEEGEGPSQKVRERMEEVTTVLPPSYHRPATVLPPSYPDTENDPLLPAVARS